jgi:hypothetical protein
MIDQQDNPKEVSEAKKKRRRFRCARQKTE